MSKIKDGLYIGNWRDAQNRLFLVNHRITHVLCAASELRPVFPKEYAYLHVAAQDTIYFNLLKHLDLAADFIREALEQNGRVLVHCYAGVSRSSSCVIAYLIKHERVKLSAALKLCKSRRAIVNPNPSFMTQLKKWENIHLSEDSHLLEASSLARPSNYQNSETIANSSPKKKLSIFTSKSHQRNPPPTRTPNIIIPSIKTDLSPFKRTLNFPANRTTREFSPKKTMRDGPISALVQSAQKRALKPFESASGKELSRSGWRVRRVTRDHRTADEGLKSDSFLKVKKPLEPKTLGWTTRLSASSSFKHPSYE